MPKGQHLRMPFSIKNWRTQSVLHFESQTHCSKELGIPIQVICDIKHGRRRNYGDFCMPDVDYRPRTHKIKDLRSGEILEFPTLQDASKALGIGMDSVSRMTREASYRRKFFSHIDFCGKLPVVIDKKTNAKKTIYWTSWRDKQSKALHYLINAKRIPSNERYTLVGGRDYKYKILNTRTGEEFFTMKLKDFAEKHRFSPNLFYRRRKKNPFHFVVVEG